MDDLPEDVLAEILFHLEDKNKIQFLSINTSFHVFKNKILFTNAVDPCKVNHLSYYDNFVNIKFSNDFNENISTYQFPLNITHLTFGDNFNQKIDNCIPKRVTHLIFGYSFNQKIDNCIPKGVTHLTFGWCFNQEIDGCIPSSVTHLIFGFRFNQNIDNCILSKLKKLRISKYYSHEIKVNSDCIIEKIE